MGNYILQHTKSKHRRKLSVDFDNDRRMFQGLTDVESPELGSADRGKRFKKRRRHMVGEREEGREATSREDKEHQSYAVRKQLPEPNVDVVSQIPL
eukprot:1361617-Amorphochlora_amoeboformis.AAC.1